MLALTSAFKAMAADILATATIIIDMNLFIVWVMLEHSLYLVVNVLCCEAELLIENSIRS